MTYACKASLRPHVLLSPATGCKLKVILYNPYTKERETLEVQDCFPITEDGDPKFARPNSKLAKCHNTKRT